MRALRLVLVLSVLSLALASGAAAYPWPFKPFAKQHPIRGFFGDPRTVYENGVLSGGFDGPGFFSFHQGVDISAPNGTPIYPVVSGVAHYLGAATLNVDTGLWQGNERVFQYFHIVPIVGEGEHVIARQTILGYVQPPYGHVHLTEINGTHSVNPLQKGHLTPYRDRTKPVDPRRRFPQHDRCAADTARDVRPRRARRRRIRLAAAPGAGDVPRSARRAVLRPLDGEPPERRRRRPVAHGRRLPLDAAAELALLGRLREGDVREQPPLRDAAVHVDARAISLLARRQLRHDVAEERRLRDDGLRGRRPRQSHDHDAALLGAERAQRRLPGLARGPALDGAAAGRAARGTPPNAAQYPSSRAYACR